MAELVTAPPPPWLLDRVGHVAQNKYDEAVTTAVEACAEDTKGQTCYICTQALHWKTKEGLVRMCACRGTAGFVHVSCLAELASGRVAEALANNLDHKVFNEKWERWHTCSECKQRYHGVVLCALGWACWRTYLGRPEWDQIRGLAMSMLGNGLSFAEHYEDALSVYEAELATRRRFRAPEGSILTVQSCLANTYAKLGRHEKAMLLIRDVFSGHLKLEGEESVTTISSANNYAVSLKNLKRFEEAKSLLRKTIPVTLRICGENDHLTLGMMGLYASVLYADPAATLDDLREAVDKLEETTSTARRVFGNSHPLLGRNRRALQSARAALRAREETGRPTIFGASGESSPVGTAVKLTGLSNGAFNGRRGVVAETSPEMRRKGRVKVIVDGRAISVKGENLVVDAPTRSAADAVGELRGRIEDLGLAH